MVFFLFKQKTAYELRISDCRSDVCSSDLLPGTSTQEFTTGTILAERYRDTAYESLVGKNGENVTAVMSAGEAMFSGLAEVSQEMMSFANVRLRAEMECVEDFAKANSPEDLFEDRKSTRLNSSQ